MNNSIWHQKSTAQCHQQNGVAESSIKKVRTVANTMMDHGKVPTKFWPEAIMTAAHLCNLNVHSSLDESQNVPFVAFFGKQPNYDELRVFGSVAYLWLHPIQRESTSKFKPTGIECSFMGYSDDMKGYRVWDPVARRIRCSSNVDFAENQQFEWNRSASAVSVPQTRSSVQDSVVFVNIPAVVPVNEDSDNVNEPEQVQLSGGEEEIAERVSLSGGEEEAPVQEEATTQQENEPVQVEAITQQNPIRQSERPNKGVPPKKLADGTYVVANFMGNMVEEYGGGDMALLVVDGDVEVPQTLKEAKQTEHWEFWANACQKELESMIRNGVFERVKRTPDMKVVNGGWVFQLKRNADDDSIDEFKARIVAKGYSQEYGVDFEEIFAPVVSHTTIRVFLTYAAAYRMTVHHVDIKAAFLKCDLDFQVYMKPPEGLEDDGYVWDLIKAVYGLRQAPKCWHEHMTKLLAEIGFVQLSVDQCVFVNREGGTETFFALYVDDGLIASRDPERIEHFKREISKRLEMKDLKEVKKFNGLNIQYDKERSVFVVSQSSYIKESVQKFGLKDAGPVYKLPAVEKIKYDGENLKPEMLFIYRSIIGSLSYISNNSRPDVSFVVNYLAQFMQKPTVQHWKYAKQVLKFVHTTMDRKLHLGRFTDESLVGYADASFGTSVDGRSQSGVLVTLFGSVVSWSSRKQDTVTKSPHEAEYIALSSANDECLWLKQLLIDWGMKFTEPTPIYEDNQPLIKLVHKGQINTRAKYLSAKLKVIYESIKRRLIDVKYIWTGEQWADMLTKTKIPADVKCLFQGTPRDLTNRGSVAMCVSEGASTECNPICVLGPCEV